MALESRYNPLSCIRTNELMLCSKYLAWMCGWVMLSSCGHLGNLLRARRTLNPTFLGIRYTSTINNLWNAAFPHHSIAQFCVVSFRLTKPLHNQFCTRRSTDLRYSSDLVLTWLNEPFDGGDIRSISCFPKSGITFVVFLSLGSYSECTWPNPDVIKTEGQKSFRDVSVAQYNYISYIISCWLMQADRCVLSHLKLRVHASIMVNV